MNRCQQSEFEQTTGLPLPCTGDRNVLALVKGDERYIFCYDSENRSGMLRTLGRFASNQELSMTWYDAAILSQKVRQQAAAEQANEPPEIDPCQGI